MSGNNECPVFTPQLDETPVPCETYYTTDCVYVSDEVDVTHLGLEQRESLSKLLDTMACRIKEQDDMINTLLMKLNKILEYGAQGLL